MSEEYGNQVSRSLETVSKQFSNVIWQQGKPPLDSELNLVGQIGWENLSETLRSYSHSGFLNDPLQSKEDFTTAQNYSNYFEMGKENDLFALVNGWVIPLKGTNIDAEYNAIKLDAPPQSDARTDFVFLEVWRSLISASPSTVNKPSDSNVWKYGNVLYGRNDNPSDEMVDGSVGFETTKRVQVQHRIRVVSSVDIGEYTSGLGAPNVLAQGTQNNPVATYTFANQHLNGDSGLWRAGAGDAQSKTDLGTVDGYVYAIPVCAVFRRNSSSYVAISEGIPNHNGSVNRTPTPSEGRILTTVTTMNADIIGIDYTGSIGVNNLIGSGLDDAQFQNTEVQVVFQGIEYPNKIEIVTIDSIDTANSSINITQRGRGDTFPQTHALNTNCTITLYNNRRDGKYADEIHKDDILDLRHSVSLGQYDYQRLLESSVNEVLNNTLKTTFKLSGNGSTSKGAVIEEVSSLWSPQGNNARSHTSLKDGPDGIREVWSDASVYQGNIELLVDLTNVPIDSDGNSTTTLNAQVSNEWGTAPDFHPTGFLYTDKKLRHGSCLFLRIGGQTGSTGARRGIKSTIENNLVRFVHPREFLNRDEGDIDPIKLRFFDGLPLAHRSGEKKIIPNKFHRMNSYLAPSKGGNYEDNYMVLGEVIYNTSNITTVGAELQGGSILSFNQTEVDFDRKIYAINLGVAFDFTNTKLHDYISAYDLMTNKGLDLSGKSSELFLVMYGDPDTTNGYKNNGTFRVIGGGDSTNPVTPFSSEIYTANASITTDTWIYCERVGSTEDFFDTGATNLTVELRTQFLDSRDETLCLSFTGSSTPIESQRFIVATSLLWPSSQGGMDRTPDSIHTIAIRNNTANFLRNSPYSLDSNPSDLDLESSEIFLPSNHHISTWSKLTSQGHLLTDASEFSDTIVNQKTVETESYYDLGSKTVMLRPYQYQNMSLANTGFISTYNVGTGNDEVTPAIPSTYLDATPIDGGALFTANRTSVYSLPYEAMPSFGRHDIPYHKNTGAGDSFLSGINHLFVDNQNNASDVFKIIGGETNTGSSNVYPILFVTGGGGTYGQYVNNLVAGQEGYVARKVTIPNTNLKGIELPPFLGVARIYGIYERNQFDAQAQGYRGGHGVDRVTPANPLLLYNIMREDAREHTLHINKDGAIDVVGQSGCHTYIVTENCIDVAQGNALDFENDEYVIEAVVFGFAQGFINENNLVLTREYDGEGTALSDAVNTNHSTSMAVNGHLSNVGMVFPSAINYGEEIYIGTSRTVYQGDPYHTVGGSSPQYSDSSIRDGQIPPSESFKLGDTDFRDQDEILIENKRNLKVLASMDFYTTLGSGSIGGRLYPSTCTDVGYPFYSNDKSESKIAHRISVLSNDPYPQNKLGVFTTPFKAPSVRDAITLNVQLGADANARLLNTGGHVFKVIITDTLKNTSDTYTYTQQNINSGRVNTIALAREINAKYPTSVMEIGDEIQMILIIESPVFGDTKDRFTLEVVWDNNGVQKSGIDQDVSVRSGRFFTQSNFNIEIDFSARGTKAFFKGGSSVFANGGDGNVSPSLVGMTSRLPLGILVNDFDFLCEDPKNDQISYLRSYGSQNTPYSFSDVPSNEDGLPYTIALGNSGEVIQMGDGSLLNYTSYSTSTPTGTKKYRIFRGGGSSFGVSGSVGGSPLTWGVDSISKELNPVLKGGALSCRAMLVKNYYESAFEGNDTSDRSYGDEIQLVILTSAIYGDETKNLVLGGVISPTGYGEGFSASDRYRITGKPLVKERDSDTIYSNVSPAPFVKKIGT